MKRFKNILVVMNADTDTALLERAVKLAEVNAARLTLIDVLERPPTWAGTVEMRVSWEKTFLRMIDSRSDKLDQMAQPYRTQIQIECNILEGKQFLEIIRQVLRNNHDLVMKAASQNPGIGARLFGTDDMHLLRKCPCPVLLTKDGWSGGFDRIMAAVDCSDFSSSGTEAGNDALNRQILEMAISLSHREDSELDVAHAYDDIEDGVMASVRSGLTPAEHEAYVDETRMQAEKSLDALMDRARAWLNDDIYDAVSINKHAVRGNPKIQIPKLAKKLKADLIVMGTVARTGIAGFIIGNTAETILNNIDCSVLALKPEGFVCPVSIS